MLSGRKRRGWVDPSPPPAGPEGILSVVAPRRAGRKSKYATPEGQEKIVQAFERYRDSGEIRSLAKVAVELNLPVKDVRRWSAKYKWNSKIVRPPSIVASFDATWEEMAKSKRRRFQERLWGRIDFLLTELEKDEALPSEDRLKQKTSLYAVQELLKMLMTDSKITGQDIENEKGRKEIESPDSGNGKGPKGGIMVNVIFKG